MNLQTNNLVDGVDYGDEEVFVDSRVVKTVRNLKRIKYVLLFFFTYLLSEGLTLM